MLCANSPDNDPKTTEKYDTAGLKKTFEHYVTISQLYTNTMSKVAKIHAMNEGQVLRNER